MVTDCDCWIVEEELVTAEVATGHLTENAEAAKRIVAAAIAEIPATPDWLEHRALNGALVNDKSLWPEKAKSKFDRIIGRFL